MGDVCVCVWWWWCMCVCGVCVCCVRGGAFVSKIYGVGVRLWLWLGSWEPSINTYTCPIHAQGKRICWAGDNKKYMGVCVWVGGWVSE